jgi:SpoVK/Ycf46/Vps4 family AAA+-type ATPase
VHQAAVRPGRIDAIIHVQRPDAEAAIRLIRLYAGDKLPPTEDLTRVGEELAGNIPAVIRECVERSKLYAIGLGEFEHLTTAAMLASAKTMKMQLDLLEEKREITPSEMAVFGQHMGSEIAQAIRWAMEGYEFLVDSKSDDAPVIESVVSNLTEASNHAGKLKR